MSMKVFSQALVDTLYEKLDVASEVVDLAIDAASDGVFNEVPLVGTGIKVLEARDKY